MLLFWCSWFKYRFIKLDLITVGKFCFHFSRVLGSVVDCVNVNPAWRLNHARKLRNTYGLQAMSCSETDHRARLTQKKKKQKTKKQNSNRRHSASTVEPLTFRRLSIRESSFFLNRARIQIISTSVMQ